MDKEISGSWTEWNHAAIENKISAFVGQEIELEIIKLNLDSEIFFKTKIR